MISSEVFNQLKVGSGFRYKVPFPGVSQQKILWRVVESYKDKKVFQLLWNGVSLGRVSATYTEQGVRFSNLEETTCET